MTLAVQFLSHVPYNIIQNKNRLDIPVPAYWPPTLVFTPHGPLTNLASLTETPVSSSLGATGANEKQYRYAFSNASRPESEKNWPSRQLILSSNACSFSMDAECAPRLGKRWQSCQLARSSNACSFSMDAKCAPRLGIKPWLSCQLTRSSNACSSMP